MNKRGKLYMQNITLQDKYFEALKLFGETDELVETALRRFIVEQATERIKVLRDEVKNWKKFMENRSILFSTNESV
jgi:hypothetical protein